MRDDCRPLVEVWRASWNAAETRIRDGFYILVSCVSRDVSVEVPVVFWFSQALSGLSFLCSALVVFMLYEFPRLRATGHNRIIVSLATSNCLAAFFQLHFLRLSVRHLPWIGTRLDRCCLVAVLVAGLLG